MNYLFCIKNMKAFNFLVIKLNYKLSLYSDLKNLRINQIWSIFIYFEII